jgi:hypothetical protein
MYMTVSQVGEAAVAETVPEPAISTGRDSDPLTTPLSDLSEWQVEYREGLAGEAGADDDGLLVIKCNGAGDAVLTAPTPIPVPTGAIALQVTLGFTPDEEAEKSGELCAQLSGGQEIRLGPLDFSGTHLLRHVLPNGSSITGLIARGLLHREPTDFVIHKIAFENVDPAASSSVPVALPYGDAPSMLPSTQEDVTQSVEKDGISFILESRSMSAVVRYVYTPIEGNLSDIEVEINNADAIKLAEDGGITVFMEGKLWSAADEDIERHFVSCEQVGESVEARWQFKRGSELADFLLRLRIEGKSLVVELEGGAGKAAGVELGYVSGAIHPRLVQVPYFNIGDRKPAILCTSGVFISSLLDWHHSAASSLHGAPNDDQVMHLNGGSQYLPTSEGRRSALRDRWVLTISRSFAEVLPTPMETKDHEPVALAPELIWCQLPEMAAGEEALVEAYEQLRMFRQAGLKDLLILHPESTWSDGVGGVPCLDTVGAESKGGDDAFHEYLDAVKDLGYGYGLHASFRSISSHDASWSSDRVALDSDGEFSTTGPGSYLLKPGFTADIAIGISQRLINDYGAAYVFVGDHTSTPPWDRVDYDARLSTSASFGATLRSEQAMLASLASDSGVPVVGAGGTHWLYDGLLAGSVGRMGGNDPARQPLLVDFALQQSRSSIGAGLGTIEQYFGAEIPSEERDSRSIWLDRYLSATIAFGHAGMLPDLEEWGMPAVAKTYYLLRKLQGHYLGAVVESIHYHQGGSYLETTDALVAGAHELSQVRIVYRNGLQLHVNGSVGEDWTIEIDEDTHYRLPPGGFLARGPGDFLVYSADTGAGRIDYAACDEYVYCDTRGQRLTMGALTLTGAAVLTTEDWIIDVYPLDCSHTIEVNPGELWKGRRLPALRLLAYRDEVDKPDSLPASAADGVVVIRPQDDVYRYRITLPEWMVEPGK